MHEAIAEGNLEHLRRLLNRPQQRARINERQPRSGSLPLGTAALHGEVQITEFLVRRGANVSGTNRDGNTALHVAAFLCREEIVKTLLENGASAKAKNLRGETPLQIVSGGWNRELETLYKSIGQTVGITVDLELIRKKRPVIAQMLAGNGD